MSFKITEWELSNEVEKEKVQPEAGDRYIKITNASYDPNDCIYKIFVKDLTNDAEFQLTYWLNKNDENNNIIPNTAARGTLIALSKALAGPDKKVGILAPSDIVGGVVIGNVVIKNGYARIYRYYPCTADIVKDYSDLEDQYFE